MNHYYSLEKKLSNSRPDRSKLETNNENGVIGLPLKDLPMLS